MRKKLNNPWVGMEHDGYNCFGCSPHNPIGLHLQFYALDNEEIEAEWEPNENMVGWINVIHGGIQATLIDEAASWWVFYYRQTAGVTQRLNVTYKKSLLLTDGKVRLHVKHVKDVRNFAFFDVTLYNGKDEVCATGEVVYFVVPQEKAHEFQYRPVTVE